MRLSVVATFLVLFTFGTPEAIGARGDKLRLFAEQKAKVLERRQARRELIRQRLADKIAQEGKARVIIGLKPRDEIKPLRRERSRWARLRALRDRESRVGELRRQLLARVRLRGTTRNFRFLPYIVASVDEVELEELARSPQVQSIEEDVLFEPILADSVPLLETPAVWSAGHSGVGQAIAILDTGVDSAHPFLAGKVLAEACFSSNDLFSSTICPNGLETQIGPGAAIPCAGDADCYHGTHVAGIAAGSGASFSGVAKDANIIAIQVFSEVNNQLRAWTSDIVAGLEHVLALAGSYDIAAANLSIGGNAVYPNSVECDFAFRTIKDAVDNLRATGIATVIAAGNNYSSTGLSSPACISPAVSVGATDKSDAISSFSNISSYLSVLAPGSSINSSKPGGVYGTASGTSMAAPHVSGAFAVLGSKLPGATVDQILAALQNTGILIQDGANGYVTPRIRMDAAAEVLSSSQPPPVNLIMDESAATTEQGSFIFVYGNNSYNGKGLASDGADIDILRFAPTLPQPGLYRVHGWWPANGNGSAAVAYDVGHDGGVAELSVDQTSNGGRWAELGVFSLSTDGSAYVDISDRLGGVAHADAVRFEFLPALPLEIETETLPQAVVDSFYQQPLTAVGGTPPYTWRMATGSSLPAGLSLDLGLGVISGTPTSSGTVAFTVEAEDSSQLLAARDYFIDVQGATAPALQDDFSDGDQAGWIVTDEGATEGPSAWSVVNGALVQDSNIHDSASAGDISKLGTYLAYDSTGWSDARTTLTMRSDDDDALGVMFRMQDSNNYYRFSWDASRSYRRLVKRVNGTFTLLAEDDVPYVPGQTYQVEIRTQGTLVEIRVDGVLIFSVTDNSLAYGSVALYTWGNQDSYFDDVRVEDLLPNQAPSITSLTATPDTLLDTETTTLSVVANDPDAGPLPLTYMWSVPAGSGSFDDATSTTPVFTPGDVASTETVDLTVDVFDGVDTVSQSLSVTVVDDPPLGLGAFMLAEDFNDGDFAGWSVMDEGANEGPSAWSATTGTLVQGSNIFGGSVAASELTKLGTYLLYDEGTGWTDYRATLTMRSDDDDAIGVMFRVGDNDNYYRFSWDASRNYRRLVKRVNGAFSLLAQDSVPYVSGQTYQVEIHAEGSLLEVRVDDVTIFSVTDNSIAFGTIALYTWGNQGSYFDDVRVEDLTSNLPPDITALTATPQTLLDTETSALSVEASDPDGGPDPLTYQWTVPDGAGSLDDDTSATPIFTPADVTSTQTVELTVVVSDGIYTDSQSIILTVGDALLLADDFNDSDLLGWTVVDEGANEGPSAWSATTGTVVQSTNIFGGSVAASELSKLGTYLLYDTGTGWTDARTTLTMRSDDDDAIGVMFRVGDNDNYYRFSWDASRNYRRLVKRVNGTFTLLAGDNVPYVPGQTYSVEIRAEGALLEVRIDDVLIFSVTDSSIAFGSIALYTWGNQDSYFDNVVVHDTGG